MRMITVAGPPSSGKTSVLVKTIQILKELKFRSGVVKFDCLFTDDELIYKAPGIPFCKGLSGVLCPDHFFVSNIDKVIEFSLRESLDAIIVESAGLCNRCSPHIRNSLAVCVIDAMSGLQTPRKIGPMLKLADIVVITKGDIVSQAEREVFSYRIQNVAPKAKVIFVNGRNGQGSLLLARLFIEAPQITGPVNTMKLRFPMPAALCSYCLGETRIGTDFQIGQLRKIEID